MMEQVEESGELVERVAALDIGKASVMACIRIPHEDGRGQPSAPDRPGQACDNLAYEWLSADLHALGWLNHALTFHDLHAPKCCPGLSGG